MAIYKTVPFAEFLADSKGKSVRKYAGFVSRDNRPVSSDGVSYSDDGIGLVVKYQDGSISRNGFDGIAIDILIGKKQNSGLPSNNDLFALYIVENN